MNNFGEIIKVERQRQHLTQRKLADKIGKSSQYIAEIEKSTRFAPLETALALTTALNLPCELAFFYTGTIPKNVPDGIPIPVIINAYKAFREALLDGMSLHNSAALPTPPTGL